MRGLAGHDQPAFLSIPLVRLVGARVDNPRLLGAIRAWTAASAGLVLAANVPMARDALTNGALAAIAIVSFGVFWGDPRRGPPRPAGRDHYPLRGDAW